MLPQQAGEYGVVTRGPEMNLRAGTYHLAWQVETDGNNEIRLVSDNGVDIVPAVIAVSPENTSGETDFKVYNETDNFRIEADYRSGTYLRVRSLTLQGGACTDTLFTLSFALIAFAVILLLWQKESIRHQMPMLCVVFFAALMASVPCFKDNLNLGDDLNFHLERLSNLTQGLLSGQLPVRMGTYMNKGFGSIVSVFSPETFLYLPALMIIAGASIQYAVHTLLIAVNLVTALGAYRLGRKIVEDDAAGAACAVLYTLAVYRLTDLYTRSALGEALAMAFLPWFARELWEVLFGEHRRWPQFALTAAALLHCHLITTAVVAVGSVLIAVLAIAMSLYRREKPAKRMLSLVGAVAAAMLLGVCLLGPMLTYLGQGVTADEMRRSLSENAMAPAQLFSQTGYDLNTKVWDGTLRSKGYEVGIPLLLAAISTLSLLLSRLAEQKRMDRICFCAVFCLAAGSGCVWAASTLFPWDALPEPVLNAASFLQFPWRLLMLSDLLFSVCGAFAVRELAGFKPSRTCQIALSHAVLALCLVSVMPLLTMETRKNHYVYYGRVSEQGMIYLDYALKGTDSRTMTSRAVEADDVDVTGFERAGTNICVDIEAGNGGTLTLPVFAFEGWQAELNGERLQTQRSKTNRLRLIIPQTEGGKVLVRFAGKPFWRILDGISLLSGLILVFLSVRGKRNVTGA